MLKKLTATGIVAAAATGVMLLGGSAHADRLSTKAPAAYAIIGCYYGVNSYQPGWCGVHPPTTYYQPVTPPVTYYPPTTYHPGNHYGWDRWHNRPFHYHR